LATSIRLRPGLRSWPRRNLAAHCGMGANRQQRVVTVGPAFSEPRSTVYTNSRRISRPNTAAAFRKVPSVTASLSGSRRRSRAARLVGMRRAISALVRPFCSTFSTLNNTRAIRPCGKLLRSSNVHQWKCLLQSITVSGIYHVPALRRPLSDDCRLHLISRLLLLKFRPAALDELRHLVDHGLVRLGAGGFESPVEARGQIDAQAAQRLLNRRPPGRL